MELLTHLIIMITTALSRRRINGHCGFFAQLIFFKFLRIIDTEAQKIIMPIIIIIIRHFNVCPTNSLTVSEYSS